MADSPVLSATDLCMVNLCQQASQMERGCNWMSIPFSCAAASSIWLACSHAAAPPVKSESEPCRRQSKVFCRWHAENIWTKHLKTMWAHLKRACSTVRASMAAPKKTCNKNSLLDKTWAAYNCNYNRKCNYNYYYITYYATQIAPHYNYNYTTLHYTMPAYIHYTIPHYSTQHYSTLHYTNYTTAKLQLQLH